MLLGTLFLSVYGKKINNHICRSKMHIMRVVGHNLLKNLRFHILAAHFAENVSSSLEIVGKSLHPLQLTSVMDILPL